MLSGAVIKNFQFLYLSIWGRFVCVTSQTFCTFTVDMNLMYIKHNILMRIYFQNIDFGGDIYIRF